MKAVIVELRKKRAAALLEDGTVVVVANRDYAIGQEIRYIAEKSENAVRTARKISAWAAGVAAVLCIGTGAYAFQAPYSYVSVDVNPSIQFTLNRYDRVLKVTAVNSDAQPIVDTLSSRQIVYKDIQQAVAYTMDSLASKSYFDDGGYVLIAAASKNEDRAQALTEALTQTALETGPQTLTIETVTSEPAQVAQANEEGISLGRKEVLKELEMRADPAEPFAYDEWKSKSVAELIKATGDRTQPKLNRQQAGQPQPSGDLNAQEGPGNAAGSGTAPMPSAQPSPNAAPPQQTDQGLHPPGQEMAPGAQPAPGGQAQQPNAVEETMPDSQQPGKTTDKNDRTRGPAG